MTLQTTVCVKAFVRVQGQSGKAAWREHRSWPGVLCGRQEYQNLVDRLDYVTPHRLRLWADAIELRFDDTLTDAEVAAITEAVQSYGSSLSDASAA